MATDYSVWLNHPSAYPNNNTNLESTINNNGDAATVPGRVFDGVANEVDYTGELTLAYADSASGTSANVDLLYGSLARVMNGILTANVTSGENAVSGNDLAIGQA